jgi:hypothetical protein
MLGRCGDDMLLPWSESGHFVRCSQAVLQLGAWQVPRRHAAMQDASVRHEVVLQLLLHKHQLDASASVDAKVNQAAKACQADAAMTCCHPGLTPSTALCAVNQSYSSVCGRFQEGMQHCKEASV